VTGDHRFVQVSAGFGRTTAIDEAGEAWSWGQGSPGDGTVDGGPVPVRAAAGGPFVAATAGRAASCGLTGAGGLACWGFDGGGHLGAPGAGAIPRRVETDVPLTALSAGQAHTCGLDASGRAHCWGSNATDQLGNPGLDGLAPGPVLGDRAFVAIEAGGQLTAAIDLEGQAWFWGLVFTADPGTSVQASSPERLDLPGEPVALAAGFQHLCGLDASGLASCWGNNLAGQLGTDGAWGADGPLPVLGDHRFAALAAGGWHTCGLDLDGGAWCWGSGVYGQVGDGALTDRRVPVAVDTDQRFGHLACGGFHCCGLVASGTSFCWGLNTHGQLGSGEASLLAGTPRETRGEVPFGTLVAGDAYTCALDLDGGAWCWGGDAYGYPVPGPLGAGSGYVPTRLETDLRFVALHAGDHHVCGVDLLGEAQCWGANPAGQLGIDDWLRVPAPFPGPEAP
jgi:alpha-tubulin suppressor-like RCC1 family protein